MIKEIHLAAQYLATASISFIKKRDDDSHTNMGWSIEKQELSSWPLSEKEGQLSLSLKTFSLIWTKGDKSTEFPLHGKTHLEVKTWLKKAAKESIFMIYIYHLHYELPYPSITDDYTFTLESKPEMSRIAKLFDVSQAAFETVLKKQELESELRVWPHHFDLGAYATVSDSLALGFGLAIPDENIDDFYYYISAYEGSDSVETKNFKALSTGEWQTGDWKAATLKASGTTEKEAVKFLEESIGTFRKK